MPGVCIQAAGNPMIAWSGIMLIASRFIFALVTIVRKRKVGIAIIRLLKSLDMPLTMRM